MENNWNNNDGQVADIHGQTKAASKSFVANVMLLMSLGLMVSGTLAYLFGTSEELFNKLYNPETGRTILGWIVMLAPIGMVLAMGAGYKRFSASILTLLFIVFSALMGMSISYIFVIYNINSITLTFFISAGMFGTMAIAGYTTKIDLSKMGSILFMALIGIIIASIVNALWSESTQLDYIISILGVIIFTGLTAYDMQKVKQIGMVVDVNSEEGKKAATMGALSLYLDFINLFLFLLRFFGNRD